LTVVIQQLIGHDGEGMTDGDLLARFLSQRDEHALAALVRRHAPMVWGVCCRLLHNHQDAEDAFQATFLVLVRKAPDVPRPAVANWLYGVARQTAIRLRALAAKRGRREVQVINMPEPTVAEIRDTGLQSVLDEELGRLPDHYRSVIVLCELEGMTRKEAARQLGIPEGSVASRLTRARAMLAKRLTRRGAVFSGGAAAMLSAGSASASAPPALVASTIKAASLLAARRAAGEVSARVAALTEGVVRAMFVTKIKSVLAMMLVAVVVVGIAGVYYRTLAAEQQDQRVSNVKQVRANPPAHPRPQPAKTDDVKAGDGKEKLQVLIDKVLQAHGGEQKLNKLQFTMTVKHSNGATVQYFIQPPDHFRSEEQQRGEPTKLVTILFHNYETNRLRIPRNGRMWWIKHPNGQSEQIIFTGAERTMDYWLDHVKFFGPRQVLRLKDADHRVSLLDEEAKIEGRAAVGVELTGPEFKGRMYFDKETHLLLKQRAVSYSDYKTFDSIPIAQKEHDGYLEPVVTDFRAVEKFDAKLFEEP
jgi:RNA polymerase sigma factor (sigma-70 family)